MMDFIEDPPFVNDLFSFVLEMALSFAKAQIEAGVDIIGVGDVAASLVGPAIYEEFVWPHEKRLVEGIHDMGGRVRLHICGNTRAVLDGMGRLRCEMVDLDWMVPMDEARKVMGEQQVLAGNMDPVGVLRNGTEHDVLEKVAACHRQSGDAYIIAAGCEVPRDTPHANVHALRRYAESAANTPFSDAETWIVHKRDARTD